MGRATTANSVLSELSFSNNVIDTISLSEITSGELGGEEINCDKEMFQIFRYLPVVH